MGQLRKREEIKFRFKGFKIYQNAKEFCRFCRLLVQEQIKNKDRDLASQIERALHSIVLNIAEGSADQSDTEFSRFLGISIRSVYETVAGFDLALLYGMISAGQNEEIESRAHALVKQLAAFRNSLKKAQGISEG
jgi:four helix bundle protein